MVIVDELYDIKQLVVESMLPGFLSVAGQLASITATILLVVVAFESFIKVGFDKGLALRPFCIAFIIMVFPYLILAPMDSAAKAMNGWMTEVCNASIEKKDKLDEAIKQKVMESEIIYEDLEDTDTGHIDRLYQGTESSRTELPNTVQRWLMNATLWLVEIFTYVAQLFITVLSVLYLTILSLLGPISFALAIVPSFRGSISDWLARYIQISLWAPLSQIFLLMVNTLTSVVLSVSLSGEGNVTYPTTTVLCVNIISVIGLFKIPTVAEWVVQSTGGSSFNAAYNKAGAKGAGAAGAGVKYGAMGLGKGLMKAGKAMKTVFLK